MNMASAAAKISLTGGPLKTVLFTATLLAGVGAARLNIRNLLVRTFTGSGSYSRIIATILVLANLKNVPFAWHFRVFNSILKHCLFSIPNVPPKLAPSVIFLPVITESHSPLTECDYNFHKSNSTYFSDLDVTRSHLVCCLFQRGIERQQHNVREKLVLDKEGKAVTGRWSIMLGGTMCSFKREIGMYEGYEMWSRLLCWDRKWIYVVTHFVKKGTVRPSSYILTDGSWFGGKGHRNLKGPAKEGDDIDERAVFASAVSKYVVKLGRLTVHPEILLQASDLLPERPGGWHSMAGVSGESTPETTEMEGSHVVVEETEGTDGPNESQPSDNWDWKRIVAQNKEGMKFVEHFAALDGLIAEFSGSKTPALGKYRDFLL